MKSDEWKNKIAGCFGSDDKIFAGHPNDVERAFILLTTLRSQEIGWKELETATRNFLKGCRPDHIDNQIEKMSDTMRFWLLAD